MISFLRKYRYKHASSKKNYRNPDYKIITIEKPLSPASEAFRRVKVGLDFAKEGASSLVVQVCSAVRGEGKTTACLNIAATYTEEGKRAIIIDLDLRAPRVHRAFGIENKKGVVDYLAGKIDKKTAIKHGANGIDFINRGMSVSYPTSVLSSAQLEALVNELKDEYDVVLIDCPPALMVSDACIVSKLCDGAVFVISSRMSDKVAVKEAVSILKQNQVKVFGCILTEVASMHGGNYYYSSDS